MPDYKCPNCQTEHNTTAQFCRRCGFKVSAPLVSPSVTEATTRNLPNPPQMADFRQTNNFGSSPFGGGQQPPPGNFQPQMAQQMPYMAVPPMPPRRSNGPKVLLVAFIAFGLMAFCMVAVLIGFSAFNKNRHRPTPISGSPTPVSGTPVSGTPYVKTFKLPSDGQISLASMSGKINVTTYDGDTIEFRATRPNGSSVNMDDGLDTQLTGNTFSAKSGGRNLSVSYDIRVPRKMGEINLRSLSGDIIVNGLEGNIKVKSTSGKVLLEDVAGSVDLDTTSGNETVTFKNSPTADVKFHSISGNILVTFPTEPDLKVDAHSISGNITSAYSLEKTVRPASITVSGVLGKGLYRMIGNTMSGDIKIDRKP